MYANDNMHLTSSPERVNVGHLFTRSKGNLFEISKRKRTR